MKNRTLFKVINLLIFFWLIPSYVLALDNNQYLNEVKNYLNSLNSLTGQFMQTDSQGVVRKGRLYIKKPNNMRIEYLDGDKEVILLNEDIFILYNTELKETNFLSLDDIPLNLLTKENITFDKEIKVKNFGISQKNFKLELIMNSFSPDRTVILNFIRNPLMLDEVGTTDGDNTVLIKLYNIKLNANVDEDIFNANNLKFFNN